MNQRTSAQVEQHAREFDSIVFDHELGKRLAEQVLIPHAEHLRGRAVRIDDGAVPIRDDVGIGRTVEQVAVERALVVDRLLERKRASTDRPLRFANVVERPFQLATELGVVAGGGEVLEAIEQTLELVVRPTRQVAPIR